MYTKFLDKLIAFFVGLIITLRILVGSNILNNFIGYTSGQGSILGRFHPATYLLIVPILLYFFRGRYRIFPIIDTSIVILLLGFLFALSNGGFNAASIIVDTPFSGAIIARLIAGLAPNVQKRLLYFIIFLAILNFPLILIEKILGFAFIPRDRVELFFRPQGFLDHPLNAGWVTCFAMWAVMRSDIRPRLSLYLNITFLIMVTLCAVRLPLLVAGLLFAFTVISAGGGNLFARLGGATLVVALMPALLAVAASLGLLERFLQMGLFDNKSAASRVASWDLLTQLSSEGLWRGLSNDQIKALMSINNVEIVENSFVALVINSGIVPAVCVYLSFIMITSVFWKKSIMFLVIIIGLMTATIILSTKNAVIIFVFSLVGLRRQLITTQNIHQISNEKTESISGIQRAINK